MTLLQYWTEYLSTLRAISPAALTPAMEKKLFKIYLSGARASFQIIWKIGEEETSEIDGPMKVEAFFQELISLGEGA